MTVSPEVLAEMLRLRDPESRQRQAKMMSGVAEIQNLMHSLQITTGSR